MKKGKSNSLLMELLIVTLFFAISASVLVEVFAAAGNQNRRAEHLNVAQATAQDVADRLYAASDAEACLTECGFEQDGEIWVRADDPLEIQVTLHEEETEGGVMRRAEVRACEGEDTLLTLPASRYLSGEVAK